MSTKMMNPAGHFEFTAEKKRLRDAGHVFDEGEMDQFFYEAQGDPARVKKILEALRRSPNPRSQALKELQEEMGKEFSATDYRLGNAS